MTVIRSLDASPQRLPLQDPACTLPGGWAHISSFVRADHLKPARVDLIRAQLQWHGEQVPPCAPCCGTACRGPHTAPHCHGPVVACAAFTIGHVGRCIAGVHLPCTSAASITRCYHITSSCGSSCTNKVGYPMHGRSAVGQCSSTNAHKCHATWAVCLVIAQAGSLVGLWRCAKRC